MRVSVHGRLVSLVNKKVCLFRLERGILGKSQIPLKYKIYFKMISHFSVSETPQCMQNVSRKNSRIYTHLEKYRRRLEEDIKKDLARRVV